MNYFIVANNNSWGHSDVSISEAMKKANLLNMSKQDAYSEMLECYVGDEFPKLDLADVQNYLNCSDEDYSEKEIEFVLIAVDDNWELDTVCDYTGSPRWKSTKDEKDTPEFKDVQLKLLREESGKISIRK